MEWAKTAIPNTLIKEIVVKDKKQKSSLASVLSNRETAPDSGIFEIKLRCDDFKAWSCGPGQFVALSTINESDKMRRPFTIVQHENDIVTLLIQATGRPGSNTRKYAKLEVGATLWVTPPRGKAFTKDLRDKHIVLVAGGIGVPALVSFVYHYLDKCKSLKVQMGTRVANQLCCLDIFKDLRVPCDTIVEEATPGYLKGKVTDLLTKLLPAYENEKPVVITCGPAEMLKVVHHLCRKHDTKCYVVLEEKMACGGSGSCYGCMVPVDVLDTNKPDPDYKQTCVDGPTFDGDSIYWDEFVRPKIEPIAVSTEKVTDPFETILKSPNGIKIVLPYPWMTASGTIGFRDALLGGGLSRVGAIVVKGLRPVRTKGNRMPRTAETEHGGMLNAIGLQNISAQEFVDTQLRELQAIGLPVIVNIWGHTIKECVEVARLMETVGVKIIELNISCPNVKEGGLLFGVDRYETLKIVNAVRRVFTGALIVKLTPNITDIVCAANAAKDGGADFLTVANTLRGCAIDIKTRRYKLSTIHGGYSGGPVKPVIMSMVTQLTQSKIDLPIIASGGIECGADIVEYAMAGAQGFMVGTSRLADEKVFDRFPSEVMNEMNFHNVPHFKYLVGSVVPY